MFVRISNCVESFVLLLSATTRYVYEKKLKRLMEPKSQAQKNGSEDKAVYSDSEEEENEEEQEQPGTMGPHSCYHFNCLGINNLSLIYAFA